MIKVEEMQKILDNLAKTVMLSDKSIMNVDSNNDGRIDGFKFNIKNPWYTAEPISCIKSLHLTVDGEKFDSDVISINVRGQVINAAKAYTMHEVWMGLGEILQVLVEKPDGLKKGKHEVEATLILRTTANYGFGEPTYNAKVIMTMT